MVLYAEDGHRLSTKRLKEKLIKVATLKDKKSKYKKNVIKIYYLSVLILLKPNIIIFR